MFHREWKQKRTFWGCKPQKNKNIDPHQNFTGSYKKGMGIFLSFCQKLFSKAHVVFWYFQRLQKGNIGLKKMQDLHVIFGHFRVVWKKLILFFLQHKYVTRYQCVKWHENIWDLSKFCFDSSFIKFIFIYTKIKRCDCQSFLTNN